jgi:hypothetical protein
MSRARLACGTAASRRAQICLPSPGKAPSPQLIQLGSKRDSAHRPLGDEPRWRTRWQTSQNRKELLRQPKQPEDLADSICARSLPPRKRRPVAHVAAIEHGLPPVRLLQEFHDRGKFEYQRPGSAAPRAQDRKPTRKVRTCVTSGALTVHVRANIWGREGGALVALGFSVGVVATLPAVRAASRA